ncbi:hypothetical protein, partial [Streptosporangium sp. NPDC048865]|uniref:hypothetical protein n=1 Tax=Streptosporangium sp. NPDC048865 TaxID=3155766 RepID=UPI00341D0316
LFAIGDGHARQGHGEVCGTAVEAAMNTVVAVDWGVSGTAEFSAMGTASFALEETRLMRSGWRRCRFATLSRTRCWQPWS